MDIHSNFQYNHTFIETFKFNNPQMSYFKQFKYTTYNIDMYIHFKLNTFEHSNDKHKL